MATTSANWGNELSTRHFQSFCWAVRSNANKTAKAEESKRRKGNSVHLSHINKLTTATDALELLSTAVTVSSSSMAEKAASGHG